VNDPQQSVNDPQQSVLSRQNGFRDLFAAYDNSADFDDLPSATDASAGLISLGFIGSALRRGTRAWLALTVIGLVVGVGLAVVRLPAHTATTTVLIDANPATESTQLQTDAAIAESTPVAAAVVAQLGIRQTPANFLSTYTVVAGTTTTILTITATGPSDGAAVQRAAAIATQFLKFNANYLQEQLRQTIGSLNQQVSQAQQHLNSIDHQISQVSAKPVSPSQSAKLGGLQKQQADAANALSLVRQNASSSQLQAQTLTDQMVRGTEVLSSATPGKRSVKKALALYIGAGLLCGLVVGMAIVVICGVTTDRLRRRDDIAIAIGAPVKLSVGPLRGRRWLPDPRGKSGRRDCDLDRVVEHLRSAVPAGSGTVAGLAVVAVDDVATVARAVIKLAVASCQQRRGVVLADFSAGATAARQLGITRPGIGTVSPDGAAGTVSPDGVPIVVVVPEAEDIAPAGPLGNRPPRSAEVSERLAETCARADLILSMVTLSPAFSSDYLRTWATDAVVVVTAGQSTATRLHAVGEMIRLAGTRLASVVVLDADRRDESLGTVIAHYKPAPSVGA
jgi:capsular polysaccharide biosynthesis protein